MGNYVANTDALVAAVTADADNPGSKHDMGGDIVPYFVERGTAGVYDFIHNDVPGSTDRDRDYWRDVGTLDAYYEANRDLISIHPVFNLYLSLIHISEPTRLGMISYAVFCLKKTKN